MRMLVVVGLVTLGAVASVRADCPADPVATVVAACPCDGKPTPNGVVPWKNHGEYVSCIVRQRNDLRHQGCLTADTQKTIARCAGRSTCGKLGTILCCSYQTGTCSDPVADGTKAGTCSNNARITCDTSLDCTVVKGPQVKRPDQCALRGGFDVGTGSVCVGCPAQPPIVP